jgi:hypothetical protein
VALGDAMGGTSELSLELTLLAHFFRGLHLHGLREMGTSVGGDGYIPAMRRRANWTLVWSWGQCGGSVAPVFLRRWGLLVLDVRLGGVGAQ